MLSHWCTSNHSSYGPPRRGSNSQSLTRPRPHSTGFASNTHASLGSKSTPISAADYELSHSVPKGPLETTVLEQCPQGVLERQSLSGACFQNPTDRRSAQEIAQLRSRLSDPSTAAKCRTGYHTNSDTPIMGNSIRRPGSSLERSAVGWGDSPVATTSASFFVRPQTAPAAEVLQQFQHRDDRHKDTGFSRETQLTHVTGSMAKEKSMTQKFFAKKHMDRAAIPPVDAKEKYLIAKAARASTSMDKLCGVTGRDLGSHPAINPRFDPGNDHRSASAYSRSCFSATNYQPFKKDKAGEGDDQLDVSVIRTMRTKDPTAFAKWLVPHPNISTSKLAYSAAPLGGLAPRPGTDADPRNLNHMDTGFVHENKVHLRLDPLEKQGITTSQKFYKPPAQQRRSCKRNPDILTHSVGLDAEDVADLVCPGAQLGDTKNMKAQGQRIVAEQSRPLPRRPAPRTINSRMVGSTGHQYKENSILDTGKYWTPLETGKPMETLQGVDPSVRRRLERSNAAEYGKDTFDRSHKRREPQLPVTKKGAYGQFQSTM